MLTVWDLRHAEPRLKLWEIGVRLHEEGKLALTGDQLLKEDDIDDEKSYKKILIANAVSHLLKRVNEYIDNSVENVFPLSAAQKKLR